MARRGQAGMGFGQAFLLVFGFLIASVAIFLLGMWVGRDLTERRLIDEPVVRMAVPSHPTPVAPVEGVDQKFYTDRKKTAAQQLRTPASPTVKVDQEPTKEPPREPTFTAPPRNTATQAMPTPTRPLPVARPTQPPQAPPPQAPPPQAPRVAPTTAPAESGAAAWTVQVGATMDSAEALDMTLRLRALGFRAFTVQAPLRGQTWYRVRVGPFATRDEARAVESKLRQGEFKGAYVTSQ